MPMIPPTMARKMKSVSAIKVSDGIMRPRVVIGRRMSQD
jgi:hypothetical protein